MENWKKALVVVAFLATIGGLVATQYAQVRTEISVKISEKLADVQLVAFDKGVTTEYLLSNDTSNNVLKVNLGTLCWHYRKTWTAAFAIVWAVSSGNNLLIKTAKILDSSGTEVTNYPVKIYLHADPEKPTENGWGASSTDSISKKYYDGTAGGPVDHPSDGWVLEALGISGVGYSGNTLTYVNATDSTHYKTFTATWYQPTDEGYIWVDDYARGSSTDVPKALNLQDYDNTGTNYYTNNGGANFVWVEIIVDPTGTNQHGDYSGYTLVFVVESI